MWYKKFIPFVIVILALASCKPEDPQFTPQMNFSPFIVYHADSVQSVDTMLVRYVDDEYILDTIAIGDTVRYYILLNGVTNELTSFTFATDTNALHFSFSLTDDFTQALDASSNLTNGVMNFKPGYAAASFITEYIAKKTGLPKVTLTLSSNSKFSPTSVAFRQPIE